MDRIMVDATSRKFVSIEPVIPTSKSDARTAADAKITAAFKSAFAQVVLNRMDEFLFRSASMHESDRHISVHFIAPELSIENDAMVIGCVQKTIEAFFSSYRAGLESHRDHIRIKNVAWVEIGPVNFRLQIGLDRLRRRLPLQKMGATLLSAVERSLWDDKTLAKKAREAVLSRLGVDQLQDEMPAEEKWRPGSCTPAEFILERFARRTSGQGDVAVPIVEMAAVRRADRLLFNAMQRLLHASMAQQGIGKDKSDRDRRDRWIADHTAAHFGFRYLSERENTVVKYTSLYGNEEDARSYLEGERRVAQKRMQAKRKSDGNAT
jgi:hypothetical protein